MKSTKVLTITPRQCNAAICLTYLAQEFMPANKRFGIFIWGASGIGKNAFTDYSPKMLTTITKKEHSLKDFNCTANNPEDVKGMPWIKRHDTGATTEFAPIYDWSATTSHGIFRCDEMDRPNVTATLQAVVKYAIDRTDDQVLPLDWFVIGQGNGCSDRNTVELSDHIKGRFIHVYASINSDEARRDIETYLSDIGASPAIKALWRLSPCESNDACFKEHAQYQPRTLEFADCLIKAYNKYGENLRRLKAPVDKVIRPLLAGAIGVSQANELFRLMEFSDLPTLGEIVNKPSSVIVPDDLSLSVKYVNTLCDFVSNDVEAKGLETYIKRFPAEITRMGLEKLATLWPCIPFPN